MRPVLHQVRTPGLPRRVRPWPTSPTATQEPGWNVASATINIPVGSTTSVDLSPYMTDYNPALHALSVTSGALPAGVTADSLNSELDVSGSQALNDNRTVTLSIVDIVQTDWLNRSTAANVVWAHDFASAAEVTNFIAQTTDPATGTEISYNANGITHGVLRITIPSNPAPPLVTSMSALTSTSARVQVNAAHACVVGDSVRFFSLPAPWDGFNDSYNGGSGLVESYAVLSVFDANTVDISTTNAFTGTINPVGFSTYNGGSGATQQRCRIARGDWHRPFSAISGSTNGTGTDDRGASVLGMPLRTWSTTWNLNRLYRWRKDYYAHANYASLCTTFPDWDGSPTTNNYRGSDFWVQARIKISASRWQDHDAPVRNPDLKLIAPVTWQSPLHEVMVMDNNTSNYSTWNAADGGIVTGYTGMGYSKTLDKGNKVQPGGDFDATCLWSSGYPSNLSSCWHWPPDEWVALLIHVIPGTNYPNWTGWPNASDPNTATGVQIFAASQSRINSMRAAGQTATYQTIMDCTGANGFPFVYEDGNPIPPAFSTLWVTGYQNNLPVTFGWTRDIAQVIFKKGNGGNNPTTDGIACPQDIV